MAVITQLPIAKIWRATALKLQQAGVDTPLIDARLLIQHVLSISREEFLLDGVAFSAAQQVEFEALIARRVAREPIAQIIGKREFYGREFKVTRDTLDPRPDSETLIAAVLTHDSKPMTILDLGTGTGCLLLTLLAELPNATGVGVDVCNKALLVAKENAIRLELNERATFVASRWAAESEFSKENRFDVVVSNPPYIPTIDIPTLAPEVAQHEPKLALDGGVDGLDCYREIMAALPNVLNEGGFAAFEIGMGQEEALAEIVAGHGFEVIEQVKDLAGITRVVIIQRKETI